MLILLIPAREIVWLKQISGGEAIDTLSLRFVCVHKANMINK